MSANLKKELNLFDVYCIATGAMISSGLFVLPGLAHAQAGPAVVFSYFLAGLLAFTGLLSQAELVSAMPKTGGDYFFVTRSMGSAAGTVQGIMTWTSLSLKSAFALVGMAAFTRIIIDMNIHIISLSLCLVFIMINIIGIREVGKVQQFLVLGLISILTIYIIRGAGHIDIKNFSPFAPHGITPVLTTAGFVFISFGGLLKVASIAEEVKYAEKTIPLGMILSLTSVVILYTATVFITSGVLGAGQLDNSYTPISDAAAVFMGDAGVMLMGVGAILAFISTANAGLMAASRYPVAMASDGLLPDFFAITGKKTGTPHISILITGAVIATTLFFKLDVLVKMASTVLITTFFFSCLSVIIMRESRLQNYNPTFTSPLYPWIQVLGMIGYSLLIFEMGGSALAAAAALILAALCFYFLYGRVRYNRESALLHLLERITARELTSRSLEDELREIIQSRDDITKDRFDRLIENADVLDLQKELKLEELFSLAAEKLHSKTRIRTEDLKNLLYEREKETSTVIGHCSAIPHVIVEGEHIFDIILVRSEPGIVFSEDTCRVHAVFIMVGSRDQRNFHLRALAAIAQIIQNPDFEKKWESAKNKEALKDILLLSQRVR